MSDTTDNAVDTHTTNTDTTASEFNARREWTRNYAPGVPRDIDPVTTSLTDELADKAARFGKHPACAFFGRELTFAQLHNRVLRFANGLRRLGVRRGDRVAIVLPNCPQHLIAYYAILRLGATVVEHNPLYTRTELRTQLLDHGAKLAIVWDKLAPLLRDLTAETPLEQLVAVDMTRAMPRKLQLLLRAPLRKARESRAKLTAPARGETSFASVLHREPVPFEVPSPGPGDLAMLAYTSGTTGTPKGAMLTHANLLANGRQGKAWMPEFRLGEETIAGFLPMFHSFGCLLAVIYPIVTAARVTLYPTFDPELIIAASRRHPATFYPGVPPMFDRLARLAREGRLDLRGVRYAMSGAMTLTDAVVQRWEAVAGGGLNEGYGLTEASPIVFSNPFGPTRKTGTIGLPHASTHIRIVDPEDAAVEVPLGEVGELVVRGPQVFSGYWNNPEETAKVLLDGGWLRTGDLVTQDADGFVTVVDRAKELIITGGYNVAPTEVEQVLLRVPGIAEAAVVGVRRGTTGAESVTAAVVLEPGAVFDEAAARRIAHEHLAEYKVPRSYVVVDELPKSLLGKVLRKRVREQLKANR